MYCQLQVSSYYCIRMVIYHYQRQIGFTFKVFNFRIYSLLLCFHERLDNGHHTLGRGQSMIWFPSVPQQTQTAAKVYPRGKLWWGQSGDEYHACRWRCLWQSCKVEGSRSGGAWYLSDSWSSPVLPCWSSQPCCWQIGQGGWYLQYHNHWCAAWREVL